MKVILNRKLCDTEKADSIWCISLPASDIQHWIVKGLMNLRI